MNRTQDWLEIQLETTDDYDSDILEEALFAAGALSVTLTSKADEVILIEPSPGDLPLWEQGILVTGLFEKGTCTEEVLSIVQACLNTTTPPLVTASQLEDKPWEQEWTKYFHPIRFGDYLWVCPSHQSIPKDQLSEKTQIITLDPGLAFGTGTHPTTAMVLEYLALNPQAFSRVIDFGCGSGILGIAAVKTGAEHAVMTDIDPQALQTSQKNAQINRVDQQLSYFLPEELPRLLKTDLLIANILFKPLLDLKSTFTNLCRPNTQILLTGLLADQVTPLIEHYQTDFKDITVIEKDSWYLVAATYARP